MFDFLARRFLSGMLTIVFVLIAVFVATRLSGDALEFIMPMGLSPESKQAMATYYGLDQSIWVQFVRYVQAMLGGDFGRGFTDPRPVTLIYAERLPNTLILFFAALAVSVGAGVPLGIVAALDRKGWWGSFVVGLAFIGYATPNFVLAILAILVFSLQLHWLPSYGTSTPAHFVMPVLVLALPMLAEIVRFTRSAMLDVLGQDYLRTARAKGLSEPVVIGKHGLRNAAIPVVTIVGLQASGLVGRCVIVEAIFATKGIGDLFVAAIVSRDYAVLQFGVIFIAFLVVLVSFFVDLVYALLDPRVKVATS